MKVECVQECCLLNGAEEVSTSGLLDLVATGLWEHCFRLVTGGTVA